MQFACSIKRRVETWLSSWLRRRPPFFCPGLLAPALPRADRRCITIYGAVLYGSAAREDSVNQGVRWIALSCSALFFMWEFSAGAVARECREIQAGWWHNQPFLGTKFSKQHFNECTRKYRKENWKVFDVSGPNCQPSGSKQPSARPETAIDECGGDGGDAGARFLCITKATACSPRN